MRRTAPFLLLTMSVLVASAFDADAWEQRNRAMAKEAVRMKAEYAAYADKVDNPAEDVKIPFETFASGEVKAAVIAKRGQFFQDNSYVWAGGIVVEHYTEEGEVDMRLEAEKCLIDRVHKCCWAAGHVRATHKKTVLEGNDAFYCSSNSFLKVMSDVKVVSEDVKMKGLML